MAALGQDALNFFDALALQDAIVVGQDWGSSVAEILTFSRQDRVSRLVKLNWYGVYSMAVFGQRRGFDYDQIRSSWHVWVLNTPLGDAVTAFDAEGFCRALWEQWSPSWSPEQLAAAFDDARTAFQQPDFGQVVLNAYRSGVSRSGGDGRHDPLRAVIGQVPPITCDTIVLTGADDPVEGGLPQEDVGRYFTGGFEHRVVQDAGHFIHRQRSDGVIVAVLDE
jgi:pimeloyl-ACP methyl ester carboxylesterase